MVARVERGRFGETNLDGVLFAGAYWWPGPIHEGNGWFQPAIDAKASPEQRAAILEMMSGRHGGVMFEIFASVCSKLFDPIYVSFQISADRDKRVAHISIPGLFELEAEPIKNPVTGEEHRAQIHLPNGFEYKYAEVGNTSRLVATIGDKRLEHSNTYAQFNAFDWNNAQ